MIGRNKLVWKGDTLHRKGSSRPLISIERDSTYPNMWRVRRLNGTLSDMVNRTRAKDAAELMVLASNLKVCRTPSEDSSIRQTGGPATWVAIVPENLGARCHVETPVLIPGHSLARA